MKKPSRSLLANNHKNAQSLAILRAVLSQVPFDGWTKTAFAGGLKQSGVTRAEAEALFPNGMQDLIAYFAETADVAMQERIQRESGFARFRVRDKIGFAVRARLDYLAPYREALRRLSVWYALPQHAVSGIKRMARTVDLMWIAAGDTATDYNRYTKRILLGIVLKTVTLFWLDDETPGNAATWRFLDRRIADVMRFGKSLSLLQEFSPSEIGTFLRRKMERG